MTVMDVDSLVLDIDVDDPDYAPNCLGKTPEMFFPQTVDQVESALRTCHECPIKLRCRDWAKQNKESGVWGGRLYSNGKELRLRIKDCVGRPPKHISDLPFELRPVSEKSFQEALSRLNRFG